jgi:phage terminase small subunit
MASRGLTEKQRRFIDAYVIDPTPAAAYGAAYGRKGAVARNAGNRLLTVPHVRAELARRQGQRAEQVGIDAERVLREIVAIALADPRELVEYFVGACRHCYGEGFKFQRTTGEFNADLEDRTEKKGKPADKIDHKGGIGYDPRKQPNKGCPECHGAGRGRTVVKDTRFLSPSAVAVYAGVKETKEGIQVLMHSKDSALEKLAKHVGLYKEDNEQKHGPLSEALQAMVRRMHADGGGKIPFRPHLVTGGKE